MRRIHNHILTYVDVLCNAAGPRHEPAASEAVVCDASTGLSFAICLLACAIPAMADLCNSEFFR